MIVFHMDLDQGQCGYIIVGYYLSIVLVGCRDRDIVGGGGGMAEWEKVLSRNLRMMMCE